MEQFLQLLLLLFLVFDLLPDPFGNCFGIDFGLLSVWFVFGFGFGFELCLLRFGFWFHSSSCFVLYFEFYCDSIVFQIVVSSCFHSRFHLFVFDVLILFFVSYSDPTMFRIEIRRGEVKVCIKIGEHVRRSRIDGCQSRGRA